MKGIIFDLDECILHTFKNPDLNLEGEILRDARLAGLRGERYYSCNIIPESQPRGSGVVIKTWGVTRPHFKEFYIFCKTYFDFIGVWTAGLREYGEEIIEQIMHDIRPPDLCFYRDEIENTKDGYHKPIQKFISHPSASGRINITNTVFIDNRGANFYSSPGNGVTIPDYEPYPNLSNILSDDICLLQFQQWLMRNEVRNTNDVRTLDKSQIFTTPLSMSPVVKKKDEKLIYKDYTLDFKF